MESKRCEALGCTPLPHPYTVWVASRFKIVAVRFRMLIPVLAPPALWAFLKPALSANPANATLRHRSLEAQPFWPPNRRDPAAPRQSRESPLTSWHTLYSRRAGHLAISVLTAAPRSGSLYIGQP